MLKIGKRDLQHSNFQTIRFVMILSVIVSFLLSIAATQLKSMQIFNIELDKKKNILKSIGLDSSDLDSEKIIYEYNNKIKEVVINKDGSINSTVNFNNLVPIENKATGEVNYFIEDEEFLPAYISSNPEAFIFPISGKGLWGTLYGYFALSDDYDTVKGITFYDHKETPGLGGEVEKKWFQDNFIGKKIYNDYNHLVSITVVKGKVRDVITGNGIKHAVDGISGATITSKGLTTFLKRDLNRYENFFKKKRK
ncbi:MAG: NADH:ubiquinone reductase (Na(+)-transporting) subunit C [Candidatus Neomarinimicrobiota bacterium]|nr:NADH:ubiquinone reductase (Na(+)-transporting) subunit C [Candidatus Neomarinimicrobiota bacterium]|tara:strand:- start:455 stop:1210 length:756 start_codon:yes stop_codon:yes gene_type:complete